MAVMDLTTVITKILDIGIKQVIATGKRSESILRILKDLGFNPNNFPSDFDGLYVYSLVEYGVGKPRPVLEFFRNEHIKNSFKKSFDEDDISYLIEETDHLLEWHKVGGEFQKMDVDIRSEFDNFREIFEKLLKKSRTPIQVVQDKKITYVQSNIEELRKSLDPIINQYKEFNLKETQGDQLSVLPCLPDFYVERNQILEKLRNYVGLTETINGDLPRLTAITGMPGSGKSILAIALVNQKDIKRHFPLGVIWSTLGSSICSIEDTEHILVDWMNIFNIIPEDYPSVEMKVRILKQLFFEKEFLIVLDDVWEINSAKLLISLLGKRSRVIITTRSKELASKLSVTNILETPCFSEKEAKELIEKKTKKVISDKEWRIKIKPFLENIRFHPLATSISAALVGIGEQNWEEINLKLMDKNSKFPINFTEPNSKDESVSFSIDLSLQQLNEEDLEKFLRLGVLAKNEYFYEEDVAMLWASLYDFGPKNESESIKDYLKRSFEHNNIVRKESKLILDRLYNLGLIERYNQEDGVRKYRLHNLIHEYIFKLLNESKFKEDAFLQHLNVYFSLLLSCSPNQNDDIFPFIEKQVINILDRVWNTYQGENGLIISDKEIAKIVILNSIYVLEIYWKYGGKINDLISLTKKALIISRNENKMESEKYCLSSLAFCFSRLGDYKKAIEFESDSLVISNELKDRLGIAENFSSLGGYFLGLDDYETSLEYSEKALKIFEELNHEEGRGKVFGNIGNAYIELKNPDKAIEYLEKALSIAESNNDFVNIGQRSGNLGNAYREKMIQLSLISIFHFRKSIRLAKLTGNKESEGNHKANLALLYYSLGNKSIAKIYLDSSLKILKEINSVNYQKINIWSQIINEEKQIFKMFFTEDQMCEMTYDICMGDEISKLELIPFLENLKESPSKGHENLLASCLLDIINGKREINELVKKLPDYLSINIQSMIVSLKDPEKGMFLNYIMRLFSSVDDPKQKNIIDDFINKVDINDHSDIGQIINDVSVCLSKFASGNQNIDKLISEINDEEIKIFIQTLLRDIIRKKNSDVYEKKENKLN
ncbi:MAG: hypothetical protein CVU40_13880 [Chloroflexi bacterium HGW-Chloroflexi-2]|jgi:tetratricopeptide (TPR) repeat protein|nr:MAG: hypothetical protein CVU40_13880 [Chloroflexi bacterium HGW-Chloroflexi-2]